MKIKYKKRTLYITLAISVFEVLLFLISFYIEGKKFSWNNSVYLVLAIITFTLYFYTKNYGYLTIKNGVLRRNKILFAKVINLKNIDSFNNYGGDYHIKANDKKMTINTHLIDVESLDYLNTELSKYNLDLTLK